MIISKGYLNVPVIFKANLLHARAVADFIDHPE